MLAGDVGTGKAILRDYINSAVGFVQLAEATHMPAKSLMRMFGPKGNPRVDDLFQVIGHLQAHEGIRLEVGERRRMSRRGEQGLPRPPIAHDRPKMRSAFGLRPHT